MCSGDNISIIQLTEPFSNEIIENAQLSLIKAVELMENVVTQNDIQRHLQYINNYLEFSPGFFIPKLQKIMRLIELLIERQNDFPVYEDYVLQMLKFLHIPPILTKSSDILTFAKDIQEYFSFIGYSMIILIDHQNHISRALVNLLTNKTNMYPPQYLSPISCIEHIKESCLIEVLAELLDIVPQNTYENFLEIFRMLIKLSPEVVCKKIIQFQCLNKFLIRLNKNWTQISSKSRNNTYLMKESDLVNYHKTSDILWSLFKHLNDHRNLLNTESSPKKYALRNLTSALCYFTSAKTKPHERNNTLALVLKLLELFGEMGFKASGLALEIVQLLFEVINYRNPVWYEHIHFHANEVDFVFAEMLLLCLSFYEKHSASKMLVDENVMNALLKFISSDLKTVWDKNSSYKTHLIMVTMDAIMSIIESTVDEFVESNGPCIIMELFKFHKTNSKLLIKTLQLVLFLIKIEGVFQSFNVVHWYSELSEFGVDTLENPSFSKDHQKCLCYLFCILQIFNKNAPKSITNCKFINLKTCKHFLKLILKSKTGDVKISNGLIVSFVDLLWTCTKRSEIFQTKEFIQEGAIYLLLDIIEECDFSIKIICLGMLVDLAEDEKTIPFFLTWRGRCKTFVELLMSIYREEEKQFHTKLNDKVKESPLKIRSTYETQHLLVTSCNNLVLSDFFGSTKPKIYALLQILNNKHGNISQAINETYGIQNYDSLAAKDKITLSYAENFLAIKLGESWSEVNFELEKINVSPTRLDSEILQYLIKRYESWMEDLRKIKYKFENNYKQELDKERHLYGQLMEARISNALMAMKELKIIAKCTEKMFRISKKFIQEQQIERSLSRKFKYNYGVNRTYLSKFLISCSLNQIINTHTRVI